jgi:hypothetical protein
MRPRSGTQHLPAAILSVFSVASASATETLTYGISAGIGQTDNVTLVSANPTSQTMAIADADIDFKKQSRLLDADVKGNFTYLDYLQGAFSNQLVGRFDGIAHFALIPERLTWVLQDNFGQAGVDPFTPLTPANLEDINYVSTGPDLSLRLSGKSYLNMGARFADVRYETSPFDNHRVSGNIAWGLHLSALSSVSLNADTEQVKFKDTVLNTDFDRTSVFGRYEIQGARTVLSADLGGTKIHQSDESTTGGLARIELSRKISPAAKLTFSLGHDLTDAGNSFSSLQSGATGTVGTAPAAQTSQSYTDNYVSAGWQYQRNRTTIALSGRWEKDLYGTQPSLDNTRGGVEFNVERQLTHAFTAQLWGRLYKTDFARAVVTPQNGSSDYTDGLIAAALTWHHGRGLEVRLRGEHASRESTTAGAGFHENRVLLTVGYRPKPRVEEIDPGI